jgi:hypothetical protein
LALSLYRERHSEDEDFFRLKALLAKADGVEQRRNQIVHSTWRSAGTPYIVTRIKSTAKRKHGYTTSVDNYNAERFREISDEIVSVTKELAEFVRSLAESGKAFNNPVYEQGN